MLLREEVAGGYGLAEAMRHQPHFFDELTIQMTEVGENSGTLDGVLDQLADFKDRSLQFKDRVVTALLYPAIVVAIALGVSVFLMTVVLPMLLENLLEAGRTLPWPTRVLKTASDGLTAHGWWLALTAMGVVILFLAIARTHAGRRTLHRAILRLPLVGPMGVGLLVSLGFARTWTSRVGKWRSGWVWSQPSAPAADHKEANRDGAHLINLGAPPRRRCLAKAVEDFSLLI